MSRIKLTDTAPNQIIEQPMPLDESLKWISSCEKLVKPRCDIFLAQSAYRKCVEHTASDMDREVGGMLVGEVRTDPERKQTYVVIQDILPALFTDSGETHVTFTQHTLVHLNAQMEDLFPGKRIVGWYHTHPRLGVFLSSHDTFLHRNFFKDPTQVALVVDPYYGNAGFFCWQDNQTFDPARYVGFYEWSDIDDNSIVEWNNLMPVISDATDVAEGGLK